MAVVTAARKPHDSPTCGCAGCGEWEKGHANSSFLDQALTVSIGKISDAPGRVESTIVANEESPMVLGMPVFRWNTPPSPPATEEELKQLEAEMIAYVCGPDVGTGFAISPIVALAREMLFREQASVMKKAFDKLFWDSWKRDETGWVDE